MGHSTIEYFSGENNYIKALERFKMHQSYDKEANGFNGDWQSVGAPKKIEKPLKTKEEYNEFVYKVSDYQFFAVLIDFGEKRGWLFVADIHH
jgi:hypothetical protein